MLKHTGQYFCAECKFTYKAKTDLNKHMKEMHTVKSDEPNHTCNSCDKIFSTSVSLKQHTATKHMELPVGHSERARQKNMEQEKVPNIECVKCEKRFTTGSQIEEHMLEHVENTNKEEEFKNPVGNVLCRYYSRNGQCKKGDQCLYKHEKKQH